MTRSRSDIFLFKLLKIINQNLSFLRLFALGIILVLLSSSQWSVNPVNASHGSGKFYIDGSQIIDPEGKVFYPIGVNVNGPESWDAYKPNLQTVGHSDDALDWNFNIIRLTSCYGQGDRNGGDYPDDNIHAIISEYTSRGIVVMAEGRYDCNKAGTPPTASEYNSVESEMVALANRYIDNPYVWFNLFNEPTNNYDDPSHSIWKQIHEDLTIAIRDTGSTNIIVVDGSNYGQENHYSNGYGVVNATDSAILKYGQDIMEAGGNCNVMFSFHVYSEWKYGAAIMSSYIDDVHDAGMALMIGEVGRTEDTGFVADSFGSSMQDHFTSVAAAYDVAPGKGVGIIGWHGAGSDALKLVTPSNGLDQAYWAKNAAGSNLTTWGQMHWNLTRNLPTPINDPVSSPPACIGHHSDDIHPDVTIANTKNDESSSGDDTASEENETNDTSAIGFQVIPEATGAVLGETSNGTVNGTLTNTGSRALYAPVAGFCIAIVALLLTKAKRVTWKA